ncbi:MAG TPA: hypothetical protein VN081_06025 [Dongiaceae bacterium]|nr:hypothetical protein [Dongiaceae bacterium]
MSKYKGMLIWLGGIVMLGALWGGVYLTQQQIQRREANNPQVQLAEDVAAKLNNGTTPGAVFTTPGTTIDATHSLAPFTVIYDKNGNPLAGSGMLDNVLPTVPMGVLTEANGVDYNFVTWQPEGNLRFAAVTVQAGNYYVMSARSLVEVEKLESQTLKLAVIAWYFTAIVWTIVVTIVALFSEKDFATKKWFTTKRLFGNGWRPISWEGWLIALVVPAAIVFNLLRLVLLSRRPERSGPEFLIETTVILILVGGLMWLVRRRGGV